MEFGSVLFFVERGKLENSENNNLTTLNNLIKYFLNEKLFD